MNAAHHQLVRIHVETSPLGFHDELRCNVVFKSDQRSRDDWHPCDTRGPNALRDNRGQRSSECGASMVRIALRSQRR